MKDASNSKNTLGLISCDKCPLHMTGGHRKFTDSQLSFVKKFKTGEMAAEKGATILVESTHSAHLFTLLRGLAFRYKTLEDGRRQILNYVMPGDLLGLQGGVMEEMEHSIETVTETHLCMFERDRLMELFRDHPNLGYDLTWLAAREEQMLDDHLLSVGRRTALERMAYLLLFLHSRGRNTGFLARRDSVLPITQQHVADTLGLSIVHTNKTLKKLSDRGLIAWRERGFEVREPEGLSNICDWQFEPAVNRPFI